MNLNFPSKDRVCVYVDQCAVLCAYYYYFFNLCPVPLTLDTLLRGRRRRVLTLFAQFSVYNGKRKKLVSTKAAGRMASVSVKGCFPLVWCKALDACWRINTAQVFWEGALPCGYQTLMKGANPRLCVSEWVCVTIKCKASMDWHLEEWGRFYSHGMFLWSVLFVMGIKGVCFGFEVTGAVHLEERPPLHPVFFCFVFLK